VDVSLRKQSYILFVGARQGWPAPQDSDLAQLFVRAGGGHRHRHVELTGIAGSYTRMLVKFIVLINCARKKGNWTQQYTRLEQVAQERDVQVASLGSLASEVSSLYGLKPNQRLSTQWKR